MFLIVRTAAYVTLFVSLFLIWVPHRILAASGIEAPATIGAAQVIGALLIIAGAVVALWCTVMFVFVGRGTPAPFDPPRRLVVSGPYRFARNPMYLGGGVAILGAALFYQSYPLLGYAISICLLTHLFVKGYEEPALRRRFPSSSTCVLQQDWAVV